MPLLVVAGAALAQTKPRARDLGVPFDGPHAMRTGVTVVLPKGTKWEPVFAGTFAGNGFGDLIGTDWVKEGGVLGGPVCATCFASTAD